ncbi:MAG: TIGR03915 family putative DNA repair protein [Desulfofustis sp. PB-SRB1]|jgi:probable DNA metabolism protein|nr:TIGR03915 family putative DNA repair protein [Desulfofustis sp. PB-SRB1]MBM1004243.1 TIGR03915 family putative DNA repair protein [Desulfofustis sp. PB-SRB1]HBH30018.1 DNA metabolism protein [Desulfofustis sp.]HBH31495.1 DNA metabolism protein [Desulfofustis sp.]
MTAVYLYDSTCEGMLCAVARAVKENPDIARVTGIYAAHRYAPRLFDAAHEVITDGDQAGRLLNYLRELGDGAPTLALNAYLSEDDQAARHLAVVVSESLSRGKTVLSHLTHDSVHYLRRCSRAVSFEAHRYKGMLRFAKLGDGMLYGPFAPRHQVLHYCAKHFAHRLGSRHWIIHDLRRGWAIYWDTRKPREVRVDEEIARQVRAAGAVPAEHVAQDELYYQMMWREFHHAISIGARTKTRLQRQFMPHRFWKYLVEQQGGSELKS